MADHNITLDASTKLAYDRTRLAYERTLMAWVRTGTSTDHLRLHHLQVLRGVPHGGASRPNLA